MTKQITNSTIIKEDKKNEIKEWVAVLQEEINDEQSRQEILAKLESMSLVISKTIQRLTEDSSIESDTKNKLIEDLESLKSEYIVAQQDYVKMAKHKKEKKNIIKQTKKLIEKPEEKTALEQLQLAVGQLQLLNFLQLRIREIKKIQDIASKIRSLNIHEKYEEILFIEDSLPGRLEHLANINKEMEGAFSYFMDEKLIQSFQNLDEITKTLKYIEIADFINTLIVEEKQVAKVQKQIEQLDKEIGKFEKEKPSESKTNIFQKRKKRLELHKENFIEISKEYRDFLLTIIGKDSSELQDVTFIKDLPLGYKLIHDPSKNLQYNAAVYLKQFARKLSEINNKLLAFDIKGFRNLQKDERLFFVKSLNSVYNEALEAKQSVVYILEKLNFFQNENLQIFTDRLQKEIANDKKIIDKFHAEIEKNPDISEKQLGEFHKNYKKALANQRSLTFFLKENIFDIFTQSIADKKNYNLIHEISKKINTENENLKQKWKTFAKNTAIDVYATYEKEDKSVYYFDPQKNYEDQGVNKGMFPLNYDDNFFERATQEISEEVSPQPLPEVATTTEKIEVPPSEKKLTLLTMPKFISAAVKTGTLSRFKRTKTVDSTKTPSADQKTPEGPTSTPRDNPPVKPSSDTMPEKTLPQPLPEVATTTEKIEVPPSEKKLTLSKITEAISTTVKTGASFFSKKPKTVDSTKTPSADQKTPEDPTSTAHDNPPVKPSSDTMPEETLPQSLPKEEKILPKIQPEPTHKLPSTDREDSSSVSSKSSGTESEVTEVKSHKLQDRIAETDQCDNQSNPEQKNMEDEKDISDNGQQHQKLEDLWKALPKLNKAKLATKCAAYYILGGKKDCSLETSSPKAKITIIARTLAAIILTFITVIAFTALSIQFYKNPPQEMLQNVSLNQANPVQQNAENVQEANLDASKSLDEATIERHKDQSLSK